MNLIWPLLAMLVIGALAPFWGMVTDATAAFLFGVSYEELRAVRALKRERRKSAIRKFLHR